MNKILTTLSGICLGICLLSPRPTTAQNTAGKNGSSLFSPAMQKLQIAQLAISALYVDSIDENRLTEEAIKKMLSTLDPHSTYSPPKEVKKLNEPLEGNFNGIGVQFNMVDDTLLVVETVVDGPSERVGILAGDRIVTVNDTSIAGQKLPNDSILSLLRGPKGTEVHLGILRRGEAGLIPFTVIRDRIPIYSIDAHYMAAPTVGYIRISRFAATTHEEFLKAVKELRKQGMKDLLIDLESNGGGYLQAAVDMANEFLEKEEVIVYTEGRAQSRYDFFAKGNGQLRKARVVVLVNEYSASASEILAGALQDWDRGVVVGRRSYGKGLVQRPVMLPDGAMIRLTTARYYTPAGRCIQRPYTDGDRTKYDADLEERFNHGEMLHQDSIHFSDSLLYHTQKLHRPVYGGGGIMPDRFVPLDTTWTSPLYRRLSARGAFIKWALQYTEQHHAALEKEYPSFELFRKNYQMPDDALDMLRKLAEDYKIEWKEDEYTAVENTFRTQFKALVARNLWGINEYSQIINSLNDIYQAGLSILTDGEYKHILSKPENKK